jgi:hypothetical protein
VPADAWFTPESWLTNFADPKCTVPVINNKTDTAVTLTRSTEVDYELALSVRRVGDTPSETGYVLQNDGSCLESRRASGYPLGEVVPLDSFAELNADVGLPSND